jgi:hypothetical protein
MEHVGAFQEIASYHAKNIIDEYHISSSSNPQYKMDQEKTVYKDKIIFKFACDYDTASPDDIKEALSKTSAELRGLNAAIKAVASNPNDVTPFYTILMALVDYKGFRIVAHADLSSSTQIVPVHDLNPKRLRINEELSNDTMSIAHALNLTSHTVQVNDDRRVRIPLAATVEVRNPKHHLEKKLKMRLLNRFMSIQETIEIT